MTAAHLDARPGPEIAAWLSDVFAFLSDTPHLVLRGMDDWPDHAGFDVDVLVDGAALDDVAAAASRFAEDRQTVCLVHRKPRGCRIVAIAPDGPRDARNWLLLDLQTGIRFAGGEIAAADVAGRPSDRGGLTVIEPTPVWQTLLRLVQALRKRRLQAGLRAQVREAARAHPEIWARWMGAASDVVGDAGGSDDAWLARIAGALDVPHYREAAPRPSLRDRLSRLLFERLFFVHRHRPLSFVLSGPDGVGKSTLLEEIRRTFEGLPIDLETFHHTTITKVRPPAGAAEAPVGLLRRLRRRLIPAPAKQVYASIAGELGYIQRLNRTLAAAHFAGRLTIADRYIYDRAVKMRLLDKPAVQRLATRIACRALRAPRLLFVLHDTPARIRTRKTELEEAEIERYYALMHETAADVGVAYHRIEVDGRLPRELAADVVHRILVAAGDDLFACIGRWEERHHGKAPERKQAAAATAPTATALRGQE